MMTTVGAYMVRKTPAGAFEIVNAQGVVVETVANSWAAVERAIALTAAAHGVKA